MIYFFIGTMQLWKLFHWPHLSETINSGQKYLIQQEVLTSNVQRDASVHRQNETVTEWERQREGGREMEGVGGGRGEGKGRERDTRQKTETYGEMNPKEGKKSLLKATWSFSQKFLGCNSHCNYSNKCTLISLAALQIRHNCFSKFGAWSFPLTF